MQAKGMQATEVTYGCLLVACERLGDVDRAFALYKQACDQGVTPSDACHNILINVCTATRQVCLPVLSLSLVRQEHSRFLWRYPTGNPVCSGLSSQLVLYVQGTTGVLAVLALMQSL